jgi:hypothetical protein
VCHQYCQWRPQCAVKPVASSISVLAPCVRNRMRPCGVCTPVRWQASSMYASCPLHQIVTRVPCGRRQSASTLAAIGAVFIAPWGPPRRPSLGQYRHCRCGSMVAECLAWVSTPARMPCGASHASPVKCASDMGVHCAAWRSSCSRVCRLVCTSVRESGAPGRGVVQFVAGCGRRLCVNSSGTHRTPILMACSLRLAMNKLLGPSWGLVKSLLLVTCEAS